jgi:hypothetical protein
MTILPPYIIEELQRVEEEKRRQLEDDLRPRLYIPIPPLVDEPYCDHNIDEVDLPRGVIIVDMNNGETLQA